MKKHVPNFLTSCNLLSGCLGIVFSFNGEMEVAVYLIWFAMLFDFADGFSARILNVKTFIGKELDSLADMVTFGVLPAVLMYHMLNERTEISWLPYMSFLIAILSALRLAKFNVDTRQEDSFIGLPTPANALFISSLVFFVENLSLELLLVITVVFSLLLMAELPLFSLKAKSLKWKDNKIRIIFVITSLIMIIFLKIAALPFIILLYILLSLLLFLFQKKAER